MIEIQVRRPDGWETARTVLGWSKADEIGEEMAAEVRPSDLRAVRDGVVYSYSMEARRFLFAR